MRAILMANGKGDRWNAQDESGARTSILKQQITIDDEEIIFRTIRMLGELGVGPSETIVVGPQILWTGRGVVGWQPIRALEEDEPLLGGLLSTRALWDCDRTVILLGDVVFSYKALGMLLENAAPRIRFLGRSGGNPVFDKEANELFGFTMDSAFYKTVIEHCQAMVRRGAPINYPPKLWALYRLICGFGHDEYKYEDQVLLDPEDYTDDVDSPQEYAHYWVRLREMALGDTHAADS